MTRKTRTLFTFLAWGAFLIVGPLVISYSLGHRVRPTSPLPESVGAFLLRTIPRGATVSINGKEERSKTPTAVSSLPPGTYTIRFEKKGYRPWEKHLPITGTRVTDIRHVRLVPLTPDEERRRENVDEFWLSPTERVLAVMEKIRNRKRLRLIPMARPDDEGIIVDVPTEREARSTILWEPREERALLTARVGNARRFTVIDVKTGRASPLPMIEEVLGWLPSQSSVLVVRSGSTIKSHNLDTSTEVTISRTAATAAVSPRGIVLAEEPPAASQHQNHPTLSLVSPTGARIESYPAPPLGGQRVSEVSASHFGDLALLTFPKGQLLLWDANERRWRELAEHAENLAWSGDGEKLLWQSSEFDVWVANIREQRTVLPPYAPELVVRLSTPIRDVQWFAGSQHLIYFERDVLTLVEIDGRDGHRREPLVSTNRGDGTARSAEQGETLLVTANRDGQPVLLRVFLRAPEDR